MNTFGYARVSSREQNCARQLDAFEKAGVSQAFVYIDRCSGKNFERERYGALKSRLMHGDTLIIKSIDRLGRNYNEILAEWKHLTKEIGVHIRVLDLPLLNTSEICEDLTATFISDIVLQILSYVAEQEHVNLRRRQKEGIALAKAQGKHMGRPPIPKPSNFDSVYERWQSGRIPAAKALRLTGLKRSTFNRFVREKKQNCASQNAESGMSDKKNKNMRNLRQKTS
jgi:DNA invertase Pin-like site-specific DNA recombinase